LTGLWQVSGKNRTTFEEMVRLDVAYGERKSLVSDLSIIIRTVPAVLTQVSDTRRSRKANDRPAAPLEAKARVETAPQAAYSATFQDKSQNVNVNTSENQTRVTARPFAGTA